MASSANTDRTNQPKLDDKWHKYLVIVTILMFCFSAGITATLLVCKYNVDVNKIKEVWNIFSPIITLVIGFVLNP